MVGADTMATSPCVYQLMIRHAATDAAGARRLQRRLQQDGVRAAMLAIGDHWTGTSARYSLRYARDPTTARTGHDAEACDFVYLAPECRTDADTKGGHATYASLLQRLIATAGGDTISGSALRRATRLSYDAIAEQFTDIWFDTIPGDALELFVASLPRRASILDAGCGPGHHARFFKRAGFEPVGLDFSRGMLQIAGGKAPSVPFLHADIVSDPLPPNAFDAVWSAVALNHVPAEDAPGALANLVNTLRPGGRIGLNVQIGRPCEIVSRGEDKRFFEYPTDTQSIVSALEGLDVHVDVVHVGTTDRNIHGLPLQMRFATVVGTKVEPT